MTRFAPADPRWLSLSNSDARAAWTESYAKSPELALRVEAASWRGKPIFFRVIAPWSRPERMQPFQPNAGYFQFSAALALFALAALLAWSNFRAGRGDIRGASRLAAFVFVAEMLEWLSTAHHVSVIRELDLFIGGVMWAAFTAALVWMLYLALEPYVRRRWPQSMVTWSRLLGGGFRDPLVGGHVLAAVAMGIGGSLCFFLERLALEHYRSFSVFTRMLDSVLDGRRMTGAMLSVLIQTGIGVGLVVVFLFFLLRVLLRRQWLAAAVFILLFSLVNGLQFSGHPVIGVLFEALAALFVLACMLWFGVLTIALFCFVAQMLTDFPLTTDFSAWYAGSTVFAVTIVLVLTAYAFHSAVAGRPLFKAGFLDPD